MESWRIKECRNCKEQKLINKKSNKCKSCGGKLFIVSEKRNVKKLGEIDER